MKSKLIQAARVVSLGFTLFMIMNMFGVTSAYAETLQRVERDATKYYYSFTYTETLTPNESTLTTTNTAVMNWPAGDAAVFNAQPVGSVSFSFVSSVLGGGLIRSTRWYKGTVPPDTTIGFVTSTLTPPSTTPTVSYANPYTYPGPQFLGCGSFWDTSSGTLVNRTINCRDAAVTVDLKYVSPRLNASTLYLEVYGTKAGQTGSPRVVVSRTKLPPNSWWKKITVDVVFRGDAAYTPAGCEVVEEGYDK